MSELTGGDQQIVRVAAPDLQQARRVRSRIRAGADDVAVIGFVGRLVLEKGLDIVASAVAELRGRGVPHHLLVVGDGPARAERWSQVVRVPIRDAAGGVPVPIYETSSAEQVEWIVKDSGTRFLVVETAKHAAVAEEARGNLTTLEQVFVIDNGDLDTLTADLGVAVVGVEGGAGEMAGDVGIDPAHAGAPVGLALSR